MLMGKQLAQVEKESVKIKTQSAMAAVKVLLCFSTTALHLWWEPCTWADCRAGSFLGWVPQMEWPGL